MLHINFQLKRFKIYHLLMLVEFQRSNGQVVFIATRHASAVLDEVATVFARSLRLNVQETRGYVDREQSHVIRIFCAFNLILTSFATSGCSNFVWKRRPMRSSDCCTSCDESSCQVFWFYALVLPT